MNPVHTSSLEFHAYADRDQWCHGIVAATAVSLQTALAVGATARLFVSGGTTPAPVYQALAPLEFDWQRVQIELVDDRFVSPISDGSNAAMIRSALVRDRASSANFLLLADMAFSIDECATRASQRFANNSAAIGAMIFGMGEDGHTASLFPGTRDLAAALASERAFEAVDVTDAPVAGRFTRRLTMTPFAWQGVAARHLLITGAGKRRVLEEALAANDPLRFPVLSLLDQASASPQPLHVHWCE